MTLKILKLPVQSKLRSEATCGETHYTEECQGLITPLSQINQTTDGQKTNVQMDQNGQKKFSNKSTQ